MWKIWEFVMKFLWSSIVKSLKVLLNKEYRVPKVDEGEKKNYLT